MKMMTYIVTFGIKMIMTNPDGDFEVVKAKLRNKLYEVIDTKLHKK